MGHDFAEITWNPEGDFYEVRLTNESVVTTFDLTIHQLELLQKEIESVFQAVSA